MLHEVLFCPRQDSLPRLSLARQGFGEILDDIVWRDMLSDETSPNFGETILGDTRPNFGESLVVSYRGAATLLRWPVELTTNNKLQLQSGIPPAEVSRYDRIFWAIYRWRYKV